jgi:hypothetical protein
MPGILSAHHRFKQASNKAPSSHKEAISAASLSKLLERLLTSYLGLS